MLTSKELIGFCMAVHLWAKAKHRECANGIDNNVNDLILMAYNDGIAIMAASILKLADGLSDTETEFNAIRNYGSGLLDELRAAVEDEAD